MQVGLDVLVDGVDTQGEGIIQFELPDTNVAQARQTISHTINLGPLHGNRRVTVTMGYATRVSGSDLLIDITYVAGPTDVTISLRDVADFRTFTAPATVARVDQWVSFQGPGGDYTLSGDTNFAFTFQPHASNNTTNAVGAARNAAGTTVEFNDISIPLPDVLFDSVEIQTAGALTGSEFRTFAPEHFLVHSDISALLANSAQRWCYGLADERTVTENAVTEQVDFTQGIVLTSPDSSRWIVTIDDTGAISTTKAP